MWFKLAGFMLRQRIALLVIIGGLTIFMGWETTNIKLAYDFAKVIPKDDSDYIDYMNFKQKFGEDGSVLVVGVKSDKLFQLDFFNDWYDLSHQINKQEGVEKVISIGQIYKIDRNDELQKFEMNQLIRQRPKTQAELDSLKRIILNLEFYKGLLFNDSGNVTLMGVTLEKKKLDSKERIGLVDDIKVLAEAFAEKHGVELHYSGLPFIRTVYAVKIRNELQIFTLISILITSVIMWFFFRSFVAVFYSLIVVVLGVVFTTGTTALLGYKISVLIGLVPPLIVIIGIQNCIYLLNVYHQEYKTHGNKMLALTRVTSKNGLALFLTNVTTAVGFGVFNFSGSSLLDEFSIVSAINIMVVYIVSAFFIPIVFSFLPAPSTKQLKHLNNQHLRGFMEWCHRMVVNRRPLIYVSTLVLTVLAFWGFMKVKNIGYILDDIPKRDKVYTDLKFFEKHFHGVMPFEIQIDAKKKGVFRSSISAMQKMDELSALLATYPQLSKTVSLVEMIKFSSQAFHNYNEGTYALPSSDEFIAIKGFMKMKDHKNTMLKGLVDSNYQTARVSVQMADIGSVETDKLRKEIRAKVDKIFPPEQYEVKLTGTSLIYLKGNAYLIDNLTSSMLLALLINSILMAFLFLSWRMILISLVPNIIPLLITLGIMGFTDIHLKPSTIIIFSITYGISIDFTIHFLAKYRYFLKKQNWIIGPAVRDSVLESGVSIVYTSVILFFGFIIFAFSSFGGTVALGVLTSITLCIGMFMNLLLLPALLLSLEKVINMKKELSNQLVDFDGE
jgi:predicted RND superfamily exporter protein